MAAHARGRHRISSITAVVALTSALFAAVPTSASAAPGYVRTIGGPRQADIYPGGLDVDADGNVYIADTGNDRVERYSAGSNTPDWVRGIRGATVQQGNFYDPRDVAIDDNYVYVADLANATVQLLNPADGTLALNWKRAWRNPIGVSVGSDGLGHERILVSNGGSGSVEIFDADRTLLLTIPPRLGANAGTRDAATDLQGNIYVADYRNDQIHKYTRTGTHLLSWGGSGAPSCAQIPGPYGVDVDDQGRVYVAASDNNRVRSFTSSGACITTFGTVGKGEFELSQVRRVAVTPGPDPKVYVADLWGIKVLVYNVDGTVAQRIGSWPKPADGGFNEVPGIAVTPQYVYGIDTNNHRVQRFDLDGSNVLGWGEKGVSTNQANFNWPMGIAVNPVDGHVWVGDTHNSRIVEFGPNGEGPLRTYAQTGSAVGKLNRPVGLAFDGSGNLFVADSSNNRVQSFVASTMTFRWAYGGGSNLQRPLGLTFDPVGDRLLVADTPRGRIVSINPSTGSLLGILPMPKGTALGALSAPEGVAVDATGAIWVADTKNNRIQKFTSNGSFTGTWFGGYGSGNTQLNRPSWIAFGPGGLLYVADKYNSRIQVLQP